MGWKCCVIIGALFATCFVEATNLELEVQAEGAILMNAETGAILFEKNPHKQLYPASITKIATAAYALHVRGEKLDKMIVAEHDAVASISEAEIKRSNYTLPAYWLIPGASHIGIKRGEELSLKDLLYGTLIASGGDASNVIAQYIGGTIPMFVQLMNEYLQELGCKNTVFKNPHGLHHPDHVTTPYDMAILTRESMKNPTFCDIVKSVRYTRPKTNKQQATTLIQTNRLLKRGKYYYPKAIGVKTGYTSHAQNTLVAAAKSGDRTLIAVLMKSKEKDRILRDAIALFDKAFGEKKRKKRVFSRGPKKATFKLPHASSPVKSYLKEDVVLEYYPAEASKMTCRVKWDDLTLPVEKDQRVGELCFYEEEGSLITHRPLFSQTRVNYSVWYRIKSFFKGLSWWGYLIAGIGSLLTFAVFRELKG